MLAQTSTKQRWAIEMRLLPILLQKLPCCRWHISCSSLLCTADKQNKHRELCYSGQGHWWGLAINATVPQALGQYYDGQNQLASMYYPVGRVICIFPGIYCIVDAYLITLPAACPELGPILNVSCCIYNMYERCLCRASV